MSSEIALRANALSKTYRRYSKPIHRLWEALGMTTKATTFTALHPISFELRRGEVLGVIGRNGAGKSTLLQLLCGTLQPSAGSIEVRGRIAALLELGAGFNHEFTGRENVYLNGSVLGLSKAEIDAEFDDIVAFSELEAFIDQPVKTYSSGMIVRLAFSVATSVKPDILIIDEALSVGDGIFARKSFDRIMLLRDQGATILFCSHALYQVESLCDRAIWLHQGQMMCFDKTQLVTKAYTDFLAQETNRASSAPSPHSHITETFKTSRILSVIGVCDDLEDNRLTATSRKSDLSITVAFSSDTRYPTPRIALSLENNHGVGVSSAISPEKENPVMRDTRGFGKTKITFPAIPLLKGTYQITVYLTCEQGIHVYDMAHQCLTLDVVQEDQLQGLVVLPHTWTSAT